MKKNLIFFYKYLIFVKKKTTKYYKILQNITTHKKCFGKS